MREPGNQVSAQDLSYFAPRQRVDLVKGYGNLVGHQVLPTEQPECFRRRGADDEGHRDLTETFIGRTHDRGFLHTRRKTQHLFDLSRKDLVATAVDDIAHPTLDPHEALLVHPG